MTSHSTTRAAARSAASEPSPARLAANQANALLSTGPKTEPGKSAVRLNAVKTGLIGQTVFLPWDDSALYQTHILAYENSFNLSSRRVLFCPTVVNGRSRLNRLPGRQIALTSRGDSEASREGMRAPSSSETRFIFAPPGKLEGRFPGIWRNHCPTCRQTVNLDAVSGVFGDQASAWTPGAPAFSEWRVIRPERALVRDAEYSSNLMPAGK
jgi:hypothetical protein